MKLQDLGYTREQAETMLEALNGVDLRRKNQKQKKQIHGRNQIIRNLTGALTELLEASPDHGMMRAAKDRAKAELERVLALPGDSGAGRKP